MAKKSKDLIYYIAGFLLIFGVSGLIYAFLSNTLIIGAVSVVVGFILITILVMTRRKKRKK